MRWIPFRLFTCLISEIEVWILEKFIIRSSCKNMARCVKLKLISFNINHYCASSSFLTLITFPRKRMLVQNSDIKHRKSTVKQFSKSARKVNSLQRPFKEVEEINTEKIDFHTDNCRLYIWHPIFWYIIINVSDERVASTLRVKSENSSKHSLSLCSELCYILA
jgi:hypothetical protein